MSYKNRQRKNLLENESKESIIHQIKILEIRKHRLQKILQKNDITDEVIRAGLAEVLERNCSLQSSLKKQL
jgi:hypothetical protein